MMRITDKLYISYFFGIITAVFIITDGIWNVTVIYLSAFIHECAHLVAAKIFGGKLQEIRFIPFGVQISLNTEKMSYKGEIVTALAGPLSSAVLWITALAVSKYVYFEPLLMITSTNFCLMALNMTLAYPLDGGRAFMSLLKMRLPEEKANLIVSIVSLISLIILLICGFYILAVSGFNISLMVISAVLLTSLLVKMIKGNYLL